MWKRDGTQDETPRTPREPERSERPAERAHTPVERATIGRSIRIRGEVSGDEDLLIQGEVDGTVSLGEHAVTVGSEGEVKADITGRLITVEGRVEGDLTALEQIILRGSARVDGDLKAPRVVLEDGARFRGGVDMGEVARPAARPERADVPPAKAPPAIGSAPNGKSKEAEPAKPSSGSKDRSGDKAGARAAGAAPA